MRKSLWALLIVVALVLSACGPAMPSATGAKTESGEVFQLALPRLEVAFDAQGNPTVLGMKLAEGKATVSLRGTNLLNQEILQHIYGDLMRRAVVAEIRFFAK